MHNVFTHWLVHDINGAMLVLGVWGLFFYMLYLVHRWERS